MGTLLCLPRMCGLTRLFIFLIQSFEKLEAEMLNGQKLQGPLTAKEVHEYLVKEGKCNE